MRLSGHEINSIKETVKNVDQDARIYLFGSRVDKKKRGGDIDLLIFSYKLKEEDRFRIKRDLWEQIGEQKIDIIIVRDESDPFTRIVLKEAVLL
ncbi:nucleotidyltransferase family protein [Syntrophomonas wolfei]|jgi:predicted nucleotidyltransferase|uniref:DNA polymerase III subunit beta n=1 Tax=Syntrophomonas wolfei TaxID=863 RepID=A0A354YUX8_9FIRM|nr:nucleotidyltransferase domain-containing protein [Syntrophomonas wolfei]HBK53168.1 DNA polymerase III subunit beta [Syntrophomonas wolfei]